MWKSELWDLQLDVGGSSSSIGSFSLSTLQQKRQQNNAPGQVRTLTLGLLLSPLIWFINAFIIVFYGLLTSNDHCDHMSGLFTNMLLNNLKSKVFILTTHIGKHGSILCSLYNRILMMAMMSSLSGLFLLLFSSTVSGLGSVVWRKYGYIEYHLTWEDAQSFCRRFASSCCYYHYYYFYYSIAIRS